MQSERPGLAASHSACNYLSALIRVLFEMTSSKEAEGRKRASLGVGLDYMAKCAGLLWASWLGFLAWLLKLGTTAPLPQLTTAPPLAPADNQNTRAHGMLDKATQE
jgi:hypothetical protein